MSTDAVLHLLARSVCGGLACAVGGALPALVPATRRLAGAQAAAGGGLLALAVLVALPSALLHVTPPRALLLFAVAAVGAAAAARALRGALRTPMEAALCAARPGGGRRAAAADVERALGALVVAVALGVHNVLEGLSVSLAARGAPPPRAIALTALLLEHVPEGASIAIPVYTATRRRWAGARVALAVGMLEPLAAACVAVCLPGVVSHTLVGCAHALVAGIITFIATGEMIPSAVAGVGGANTLSSWMGAGVMTATICQPLLACKVQEDAVR
eukprot:IDg15167t1